MDDAEKRQEREVVDEAEVVDVDLPVEAAEDVRGGDTSTLASNVIKTQQDTAKNTIGNIRG
jgi:hypothetical protein